MKTTTLDDKVAEIEGLMADRLRVRGRDLGAQIKKAGRLLPRRVAREARYLAEAATFQQNPKLARMIDAAKADQAHQTVRAFLNSVDPAERRKDRILGILGIFAFNFLLIAGGIITYLWWQGHV